MRRWLSILLLVMLPFQFTWAAAASYCQHETGQQASHFGHHEHKHQAAKTKSGTADRSDSVGKLGALDDDCAVCHLSCVPPLAPSQVVFVTLSAEPHSLAPERDFESYISGVPQRPDCFLAA